MRLILASLSFAFLLQTDLCSKNADEFIEEVEELNQKMQAGNVGTRAGQGSSYQIPSSPVSKKRFAPNAAPTPEARAELMINNLSDTIRDLTGKVETLEHKMSLLEQKLADKSHMVLASESVVKPEEAAGEKSEESAIVADAQNSEEKYASSKEATVKSLGTLSQEKVQEVQQDVKTVKLEPVKPLTIPAAPKDHYDYAYNLLISKDLGGAQIAFKSFIKKYPNHELAANAKYWLGETHYASQNFPKAAKKFLVGYQDHKTSPKAPDNLLKLALSLEQLKENQKACTILKKIKTEYPKSTQIIERANQEAQKLKCQ